MKTVTQLNYRKRLAITISTLLSAILLLSLYILVTTPSQPALGSANEDTYCSSSGGCHLNASSPGTQWVGRYDLDLTANWGDVTAQSRVFENTSFGTADLWIGEGRRFELDWYANLRAAGAGVGIIIPQGWTFSAGAANTSVLTNWKTQWDVADGNGVPTPPSWGGPYNDGTQPTQPGGGASSQYSIDYSSSSWGPYGTRAAANDTGSGADQDVWGAYMGTDARITVPSSTTGNWLVELHNAESKSGSTKYWQKAIINVRIANVTDVTMVGAPYNTNNPPQTIHVDVDLQNTSSTTALSGTKVRYWVFKDADSDGKPDDGEEYLRSDNGWQGSPGYSGWRSQYSGETSPSSINASSTLYDWEWASLTNQNFPQITTYTCYVEWYQLYGSYYAIIDNWTVGFYSVPTLGWWLTGAVILFVAVISISSGALYLRRNHH